MGGRRRVRGNERKKERPINRKKGREREREESEKDWEEYEG